jgi:brefeldin A-inhibited guanine nucleotide-exchange protein
MWGVGFEKSMVDRRAELDCIAKTHLQLKLILCRSTILSSALLPALATLATSASARTWLLRRSAEHPRALSLIELVVHTITFCPTSSPNISLQVVGALLAVGALAKHSGSSESAPFSQGCASSLYNIFLMSNDLANQKVAQGGLTQGCAFALQNTVVVRIVPRGT